MNRKAVLVVLLFFLVLAAPDLRPASAQPNHEPEMSRQVPVFGPGQPEGQAGSAQSPTAGQVRSHTALELGLSIGVLVFGALAMGMQIYVMIRANRYWDSLSIKIVGLTLVITAALFLIVAGYSQDQVAPIMGILGTVVGFLLGKEGVAEPPAAPATPSATPTSGA